MEVIDSREIKGIYKNHDLKKLNGSHYTPSKLAQFVAARILENFKPQNQKKCSIFDPAVGDGELLYALAELLISKGYNQIDIFGYDIDSQAVAIANQRLKDLGSKVAVEISENDFTFEATSTLGKELNRTFDLIIANPPYVRTQSLGAKNTSKLSADFDLDGRIDLYYVFLLGIKKFMNEHSVAGYIVSNRFMTTKSGASVRKGLLDSYQIDEVWDFGDTRLFDAAVLPAVLIYSLKKSNKSPAPTFSSIYSTSSSENSSRVDSVFDAVLNGKGIYFVESNSSFEVKSGHLQMEQNLSDVWRISNSELDKWMKQVDSNTDFTFNSIGKVRVGVKTTADKVFIRKDWDSLPKEDIPEDEILFPLITHHFAKRFKENKGNSRKILYPHISVDGKKQAVDIHAFPKAKRYLTSHKEQLESREYLIQAGRNWYEIWVPHEPALWKNPKIVFRDIAEKPTFWMDKTGAIVNGDCYWITANQGVSEDYLWVALAVANSTFIEHFYDHKFNNKLYAGRRRFMTQYVEQFPIPKLDEKNLSQIVELTKTIYNTLPKECPEQESELDTLIWKSFGF